MPPSKKAKKGGSASANHADDGGAAAAAAASGAVCDAEILSRISGTTDVNDPAADALVVVAPLGASLQHPQLDEALHAAAALDATVGKAVSVIPAPGIVAGGRLVHSPCGRLNRDYDDVRAIGEAAASGIRRAVAAGARNPILSLQLGVVSVNAERYVKALEVAILGALEACYVPLEVREDAKVFSPASIVKSLKIYSAKGTETATAIATAVAVEAGRIVSRDVCGTDPERMTSIRAAEYITAAFSGTEVKVNVESGDLSHYPLLSAVARASQVVDRHRPCVINLEYAEGTPSRTLFFVGKGITYDTGGADVKIGGYMAGMHRDKGGAASVAGFFKTLTYLKPKNIRVVGKLAMVRNSIGEESYVADEIIRSRAGVRVRVGNTDAEGRMVMADLLCKAKEEAVSAPLPRLFTVATLTGHVVRSYGPAYSGIMDNGPAAALHVSEEIARAGLLYGDPCEISTLRREDFDFVRSKYPTEDIVQCNTKPSSETARGHQFPAAFMISAAGLDKHGLADDKPLPYTHIDIAGSVQMWPTPVSGAPIPALVGALVL